MLLLIVVAMVGGVFAWLTTMREDVEEGVEEDVMQFLDRVRDEVNIVTYSCDDNDHIDTVSVSSQYDGELDLRLYADGNFQGDVDDVEEGDTEEIEMDDDMESATLELEAQGVVIDEVEAEC